MNRYGIKTSVRKLLVQVIVDADEREPLALSFLWGMGSGILIMALKILS